MVSLLVVLCGQINFTVSPVEPRDTFYTCEDVSLWITLENTTNKKLPVGDLIAGFDQDPSPWSLVILDEKGDTVDKNVCDFVLYGRKSSPDTLMPKQKTKLRLQLAEHGGCGYSIWKHPGQWLTIKRVVLETRDGYYYEEDVNVRFYVKSAKPEVQKLYEKFSAPSPGNIPIEEKIAITVARAEDFLAAYPRHPYSKRVLRVVVFDIYAFRHGETNLKIDPSLAITTVLSFPHYFVAISRDWKSLDRYVNDDPETCKKLRAELRLKAQSDPYLAELMREKGLLGPEDQR